jgi:Na+-driven multidrug efflux pump
MMIIGQLNDEVALAAVGLGNIVLIMCVMSFVYGMNTSLETLVSQSHGAGQHKLSGNLLNRMRVIITIMFIPITLFLS